MVIVLSYCVTEISKVFNNYHQISSEFMTSSIEVQMLSEDATIVNQKLG